jgi:hypothetical protein
MTRRSPENAARAATLAAMTCRFRFERIHTPAPARIGWLTFLLAPAPMYGDVSKPPPSPMRKLIFMRIRAAKVGLLERMFQVGSLKYHESIGQMLQYFNYIARSGPLDSMGRLFVDYLANSSLPTNVAAREIEVFNRLFPELQKLERYERRALSRRKFALRTFGAFR